MATGSQFTSEEGFSISGAGGTYSTTGCHSSQSGCYAMYTVTQTGTVTVTGSKQMEILIVGGGGGGGTTAETDSYFPNGGAGGGGGGITLVSRLLGPGTYNVTVGAGGQPGQSGSGSSFDTDTSGGGAGSYSTQGGNGGDGTTQQGGRGGWTAYSSQGTEGDPGFMFKGVEYGAGGRVGSGDSGVGGSGNGGGGSYSNGQNAGRGGSGIVIFSWASPKTCKDFGDQSVIEFRGKVDFTKPFSPVTSLPASANSQDAKAKECKVECQKDLKCGMWSVSGATCRKFLVDGDESIANDNGLIVNPNYMYNSGFPDSTYSTTFESTVEACKARCKADTRCNFFEYSSSRQCKLNTCSSPFPRPTGYTKTWKCTGFECVKGKTYRGPTTQITFHPTALTFLRYPGATCSVPISYTLSADKNTITISGGGGKFTSYTGSTITYTPSGAAAETLTFVPGTPAQVCSPSALPFLPPLYSTTCNSEGIFECVKGKEFYGSVPAEFGNAITVKFDTTFGRLFLGIHNDINNMPVPGTSYSATDDSRTSISFSDVTSTQLRITRSGQTATYVYSNGSWGHTGTNLGSFSIQSPSIVTLNGVEYMASISASQPSVTCHLVNYTVDSNNVIGFTWETYTFGLYNYIDGDPWSLSVMVRYPTGGTQVSGTLTGGPTTASKMPAGVCSVGCLSDSITMCPSGTMPLDNNTCGDGSIAKCFSLGVSPFTSTLKFMNYNDYSEKIVLDPIYIEIFGIQYRYVVSSVSDDSNSKIIYTKLDTYWYNEKTVDGISYKQLWSLDDYTRYVEMSVYFYKRTIIAPVPGSTKTETIPQTTNRCLGTTPGSTTTVPTLYHCYTFHTLRECVYSVVEKSKFTTIHAGHFDSKATNVEDRFVPVFDTHMTYEQVRDPYVYSTSDVQFAIPYRIDPVGETMTIDPHNLPGNVDTFSPSSDVLQLYSKLDYRFDVRYGNEEWGEGFRINLSGQTELDRLSGMYSHVKCISGTDVRYFIINGKSQASSTREELYDDGSDLGSYRDVTTTFDVLNLVSVALNGFELGDNPSGFFDTNSLTMVFGAFVDGRPQQISVRNRQIESNCTVGPFFLYDSQFMSGVPGYNRCSVNVKSGLSSSATRCTSIYDAVDKCDMEPRAVGFEWKPDVTGTSGEIKYIYTADQFGSGVTTNYDDILAGVTEDGLRYSFSTTDNTYGPQDFKLRYDITNLYILVHNIFPTERVSPMSDGQIEFTNDTVNGNMAFGRTYQKPGYPTNFGSATLTFSSVTTRDTTKIVYMRSTQPNMGGKFLRAVPLLHRLPYRYEGTVGKMKSDPIPITVTSITIDGTQNPNQQMYLYRLEQGYENETFLLSTTDGSLIDRYSRRTGIFSFDCLWNPVVFKSNMRKLFLVSVDDENVVLELDLGSDFPSELELPRVSTFSPPVLDLNPNDFTCTYFDYDQTLNDLEYKYSGNHLIIYRRTCKSDKTESINYMKIFRFEWDGTLLDESTGTYMIPKTPPGVNPSGVSATISPGCDTMRMFRTHFDGLCPIQLAWRDYCNNGDGARTKIARGCADNLTMGDINSQELTSSCRDSTTQPESLEDLTTDSKVYPPANQFNSPVLCDYYRGKGGDLNFHRGSFVMFYQHYTSSAVPNLNDLVAQFFASMFVPPFVTGDKSVLSNFLYFLMFVPFTPKIGRIPRRIVPRKIPDTPVSFTTADLSGIVKASDEALPISPIKSPDVKPPPPVDTRPTPLQAITALEHAPTRGAIIGADLIAPSSKVGFGVTKTGGKLTITGKGTVNRASLIPETSAPANKIPDTPLWDDITTPIAGGPSKQNAKNIVKNINRSENSVPTPIQDPTLRPSVTNQPGTFEGPRFSGNVVQKVTSMDEYATLEKIRTALRNSQPGGS